MGLLGHHGQTEETMRQLFQDVQCDRYSQWPQKFGHCDIIIQAEVILHSLKLVMNKLQQLVIMWYICLHVQGHLWIKFYTCSTQIWSNVMSLLTYIITSIWYDIKGNHLTWGWPYKNNTMRKLGQDILRCSEGAEVVVIQKLHPCEFLHQTAAAVPPWKTVAQ